MEREGDKQYPVAEDLDDIATLMNLLELRSRLRFETNRFDDDLD
jgi:hypothetical protein